jgi:hypothetical protein
MNQTTTPPRKHAPDPATGTAPNATPPVKVMTGMQVYRRLLSYLRPYAGVFFVCVLGYMI